MPFDATGRWTPSAMTAPRGPRTLPTMAAPQLPNRQQGQITGQPTGGAGVMQPLEAQPVQQQQQQLTGLLAGNPGGMVPGITGSMGTNPGGQTMTPGGGGANPPAGTPGGPPIDGPPTGGGGFSGFGGGDGNYGHNYERLQALLASNPAYAQAFEAFRSHMHDHGNQRPSLSQFANPEDFRAAMQQWQQNRPRITFNQGGMSNGA